MPSITPKAASYRMVTVRLLADEMLHVYHAIQPAECALLKVCEKCKQIIFVLSLGLALFHPNPC